MRAKVHRSRYLAHAKVIAVTGSCGKTSATYFLGKILTDDSTCFVGVHNNNRDAIKNTSVWNPETLCLFCARDRQWPKQEIWRKDVALLRPNVGIVTTIGQDDYTSFRTLDATAAEKGKLLQVLSWFRNRQCSTPMTLMSRVCKHLTRCKNFNVRACLKTLMCEPLRSDRSGRSAFL